MISQFTEITATTVNNGWLTMWLMAGALFLLGKLLVLSQARTAHGTGRLAFTLFWPGMDLAAFLRRPAKPVSLWLRGAVNLVGGATLVWVVAREVPSAFAATWVCMVGFIWALHGGVFTLLAAFWRNRGHDVEPLMRAPLLAASVTEFWGKRWNHAFRDLSHTLIFKPATRHLGAKAAMMIVFLASGLVHELVITVPAGGGYGGPTLYFALQSLGIWLECGCPLKNRFIWRARTFAFVLLPLPAAFPEPFVMNVCQPFFHFIGALN